MPLGDSVVTVESVLRPTIPSVARRTLQNYPSFKLAVAFCQGEWPRSPKFANSTEFRGYSRCLAMVPALPIAGARKLTSARRRAGNLIGETPW